ncbi:hypothetical protein ANN_22309 [Periplaneta americana]|uniref:Uncharacterized protein n=1 Tax=Periplaneta americana TaxID=6978 RepID=A0ABQ8S8F8_PERAM|nr:hypothetical protein ANN_22309 [Periplaneta americana]
MSPGSSTESYPAFGRIELRENPGKNLNQIICSDRDSNPDHLVSRPDALTVTPQRLKYVSNKIDKYKINRREYEEENHVLCRSDINSYSSRLYQRRRCAGILSRRSSFNMPVNLHFNTTDLGRDRTRNLKHRRCGLALKCCRNNSPLKWTHSRTGEREFDYAQCSKHTKPGYSSTSPYAVHFNCLYLTFLAFR